MAGKKKKKQGWSDIVSFGDFNAYRERFEKPQKYFAPRFEDATKLGNQMIRTILEQLEKAQLNQP